MVNKYTRQKVDINKAIELYESGMTQAEVAEELETTQKVIFSRLKEVSHKCRVAKKRDQAGKNNHSWKGDDASYAAFHYRVKALFGMPQKCEVCKTTDKNKTYDWANLTGNYNDPKDYKRMCRSCHFKYDKIHLNFNRKEEK